MLQLQKTVVKLLKSVKASQRVIVTCQSNLCYVVFKYRVMFLSNEFVGRQFTSGYMS